ncbi:MAG TPA: acyl-CoA dehydrogenase family protein [Allosphingosinicella sp.]|nr:acyl-CoA dehydrogenase family protein [Allosphingosinicella sp.]
MDLDFTPEDDALRAEMRAWLEANVPSEPRPAEVVAAGQYDRDWQRRLHDGGWAGINWPKDYGGRGLSAVQQMIWFEEAARANAPAMNSMLIALMHGGPTLIARGSEAQKAFHLPRILSGEAVWCQGFSEPGAGSDLAAIKTRGRVEGDELVVDGQKMWTSFGHWADYQELLVRTAPDSKRQQGLTWVICDMKLPGIDIKPVLSMSGEHHVNMVFYDNVRIPLANVVGGVGEGWSVAMSTLAFERGTAFLADQVELAHKIERTIALARKTRLENGRLAIEDDGIAQRLARLKADTMAIRAMTILGFSRIERANQPGPEGSMLKLFVTTTYKALSELAAEISGWGFFEYGDNRHSNRMTYDFMWSWVLTIAAGSSEIQREIIADRVLGLPRAR